MWICPRCGEESEDNFNACWNCQRQRPGLAPSAPEAEAGRAAPGVVWRRHTPEVWSDPGAPAPRHADEHANEYRVVPFIGEIKNGIFVSQDARAVAEQLQDVINEHARRGWEFHGLEKVDVAVTPGCLASLFGATTSVITFDQLVFKRARTP